MSRIKRLHQRLMNAIIFLKKGGVLQKYRANHVIGERHSRYVRLSPDLSTMEWLPPASGGSAPPPSETYKGIAMVDIGAVTDGAKTGVMKKMYQREQAGGSVFEKMLGMRPFELELRCAFSIIVKDRTIDFVAKTPESRDEWLQHLNILLVHQRTHDTDKVMGRQDVVNELHMMSFQIAKLNKQTSKAKARVKRASMFVGADKAALARITEREAPVSTRSSLMSSKM